MDAFVLVANVDHSDHDCLLISILSHGQLGWIYAKDTCYKLEDIWCYFTAPRCPTLAGKPKLFFIQACQGDSSDDDFAPNRTETDSSDNQSGYKIPIHADFLIAYSTIPGAYMTEVVRMDGNKIFLVYVFRQECTQKVTITLITHSRGISAKKLIKKVQK